jgi:hypothetical protein
MLRSLPLDHYDFAYIDGSHIAPDVLEDAVLAFRLLKPGARMILDDYQWNLHEDETLRPKLAIDAFLSVFRRRCEVLHGSYQVIVRKL